MLVPATRPAMLLRPHDFPAVPQPRLRRTGGAGGVDDVPGVWRPHCRAGAFQSLHLLLQAAFRERRIIAADQLDEFACREVGDGIDIAYAPPPKLTGSSELEVSGESFAALPRCRRWNCGRKPSLELGEAAPEFVAQRILASMMATLVLWPERQRYPWRHEMLLFCSRVPVHPGCGG